MDSRLKITLGVPLVLILASCFSQSSPESSTMAPSAPEADSIAFAEESPEVEEERAGGPSSARRSKPSPAPARAARPAKKSDASNDASPGYGGAATEVEPERTRDWFPDAFLWEPMVETDADGLATIPVRVPDTLTDWRVLGLAHDKTGQQAGALTHFASRLPVYGEPSLPSFLFAGDQLKLPVRAVNGTRAPLVASVQVTAEGSLTGAGDATIRLGPNGVGTRAIPLRATDIGTALVRTRISGGGHNDVSERRLRVLPTGLPVKTSQRGALSAEVALDLPAPEGEGLTGETLEVVVFPGPMALVQAEVDRLASGARPALPGASLSAAHHLSELAERTGATIDETALRRLRLLGWQRIAREIPNAREQKLVGLLLATADTDEVGGVEAARPGLVSRLTSAQRPDGTWSWSQRSTLQQVLVQSALAAMVLPESEVTARLKAEGAAERHLPSLDDPYTAAVLVGSGVLSGEAAAPAIERIQEALVRSETGVPRVAVPEGVVDAWGQRPSEAAMLAWTVLALNTRAEAEADRGMLAAELLGSWTPSGGFGAGRADPIAMRAVVEAIPGASGPTTVSLVVEGRAVASGTVDPTQPGVPIVLSARTPTGALTVDPPVSGLAYTATRTAWAPWPKGGGVDGIERELKMPDLAVGERSTIALTIGAPKGTRVTLEQGIPAGMRVDPEALKNQTAVAWAEVLEDRVRVGLEPMPAVGAAAIELAVTPQFAGTFTTVPGQMRANALAPATLEPEVWTVAL